MQSSRLPATRFLLLVLFLAGAARTVAAQSLLIENVTTANRSVRLTFQGVPGDTLTPDTRAGVAGKTFAGYRVWRRLADAQGPFELLREFSLLEETWTFVGGVRVFVDPDSVLPRRNPPLTEIRDNPNFQVSGPVNGFKYNYSITWFEASLDTTVIPPLARFFPASDADVEASAWPATISPSEPARLAVPLLGKVRVVPNPYNPSAPFGSQVFPGPPRIQFVNLPSPSQVDVYSIAGDLVRRLRHEAANDAIDWDLKNQQGEDVVSGIYVYRVAVPSGEATTGRFVVVR